MNDEDAINRVRSMKFKSVDDIINLSDQDFSAWIYLKSRYQHGNSEFILSVIIRRHFNLKTD